MHLDTIKACTHSHHRNFWMEVKCHALSRMTANDCFMNAACCVHGHRSSQNGVCMEEEEEEESLHLF